MELIENGRTNAFDGGELVRRETIVRRDRTENDRRRIELNIEVLLLSIQLN